MRQTASCALALALLASCGPTIGDSCTTSSECLGQVCLNTDYSPGGYCSSACKAEEPATCPTGTQCIRDALGHDNAGCMRTCRGAFDCRSGYVCKLQKGSTASVCVGPTGI